MKAIWSNFIILYIILTKTRPGFKEHKFQPDQKQIKYDLSKLDQARAPLYFQPIVMFT